MSILMKYGFTSVAFIIAVSVFLYFFNPSLFFPDQCVFSGSIVKCVDHSVKEDRIELFLENQFGGEDIIIQDIVATSEVLDGACSLSDSNRNTRINKKKQSSFVLDKSADGSPCVHKDTVREKNRYDLKLTYARVTSRLPKHIDGKIIG